MPHIAPFRGLRYSITKINNLSQIICPPYDVISPDKQSEYYQRHPYNAIRLILGKDEAGDNGINNKYSRARDYFQKWQEENVLVRDEMPSIYVYQQEYRAGKGNIKTLKGFMVLTELMGFGTGVVFPHERTLSKPKEDRLRLMKACQANLCPIFSLYDDHEDKVGTILSHYLKESPQIDSDFEDGSRHRVWAIIDQRAISRVKEVMEGKPFFIADGHHRYETALIYRDLMRNEFAEVNKHAPFNYIMMYFVSMEDSGLLILPTHRVLHGLNNIDIPEFMIKIEEYFEIEAYPFTLSNQANVCNEWLKELKNYGERNIAIGLSGKGEKRYLLLKLRDIDLIQNRMNIPDVLKELDVAVLHNFIFHDILKISLEAVEAEKHIKYVKDAEQALKMVKEGNGELAFIMNPPKIEQVKKVASAGEKMPQKTTYFYPKPLSGLVFNKLTPDERVEGC